jgi:CBS domain-containing protein
LKPARNLPVATRTPADGQIPDGCQDYRDSSGLPLFFSNWNVTMRAIDVRTTEVISVGPDTSVQALAALLSERGISGVRVVDADKRVVGIVSEGDLPHRVETGTEHRPEPRIIHRRSWWLDTIASDRGLARDYVKSPARTVRDIMTRDVVSVSDTAELADIAMLLETKRIKRLSR